MRVYTGVVAILVESAAPLTVFGIIAAILQQLNAHTITSPEFYACNTLFSGLFYSFCALSPQMIIFRVTTGRSFTKFPTTQDGVLSNPIQFAHQSAESSFLQTTFGREIERASGADAEHALSLGAVESKRSQVWVDRIGKEAQHDGEEARKSDYGSKE
ncbi:hypothetical protein MD484_g2434, partial [Candolleomyces efflorescens]